MSCVFQSGDEILWNPSNAVGQVFTGEAEVLASTFGRPSGLGAIVEDECEVDMAEFENFVHDLVRRYDEATHPILRSLMVGFIATALVILDRGGGKFPHAADTKRAAWLELCREHAKSMPR